MTAPATFTVEPLEADTEDRYSATGRYRVVGIGTEHIVTIENNGPVTCTCVRFRSGKPHRRFCPHLQAVLDYLDALREALERADGATRAPDRLSFEGP